MPEAFIAFCPGRRRGGGNEIIIFIITVLFAGLTKMLSNVFASSILPYVPFYLYDGHVLFSFIKIFRADFDESSGSSSESLSSSSTSEGIEI